MVNTEGSCSMSLTLIGSNNMKILNCQLEKLHSTSKVVKLVLSGVRGQTAQDKAQCDLHMHISSLFHQLLLAKGATRDRICH